VEYFYKQSMLIKNYSFDVRLKFSFHAKQNKYITFVLSPAEELTKSAEYIRKFLPFDLFPKV
jgi:hypothetical protein